MKSTSSWPAPSTMSYGRTCSVHGITTRLRADPQRNHHLLGRLTRGTQAQRFDTVMGLQSKDDIRALANYLVQAWDLRTAFLARMAEPSGPVDAAAALPDGEGGADSDSVLVLEP